MQSNLRFLLYLSNHTNLVAAGLASSYFKKRKAERGDKKVTSRDIEGGVSPPTKFLLLLLFEEGSERGKEMYSWEINDICRQTPSKGGRRQ